MKKIYQIPLVLVLVITLSYIAYLSQMAYQDKLDTIRKRKTVYAGINYEVSLNLNRTEIKNEIRYCAGISKLEKILSWTANIPPEKEYWEKDTYRYSNEVVQIVQKEVIETIEVETTAYEGSETSCDEFADGYTATMTLATAGRTIAVDPTVIPLGTHVVIDGHEYVAEDTGGAIKGNKVDIYFNSIEECMQYGVRKAQLSYSKVKTVKQTTRNQYVDGQLVLSQIISEEYLD